MDLKQKKGLDVQEKETLLTPEQKVKEIEKRVDSIKTTNENTLNELKQFASKIDPTKDITDITDPNRNLIQKLFNLDSNQGVVSSLFEIINRPAEALQGAVVAGYKGEDLVKNAVEGLFGFKEFGFKSLGIETGNTLADIVGSLAFEIAIDPLNFMNLPVKALATAGKGAWNNVLATVEKYSSRTQNGTKVYQDFNKLATKSSNALKKSFDLWTDQGYKKFAADTAVSNNLIKHGIEEAAAQMSNLMKTTDNFVDDIGKNWVTYDEPTKLELKEYFGLEKDFGKQIVDKTVDISPSMQLAQKDLNHLKVQVDTKLSSLFEDEFKHGYNVWEMSTSLIEKVPDARTGYKRERNGFIEDLEPTTLTKLKDGQIYKTITSLLNQANLSLPGKISPNFKIENYITVSPVKRPLTDNIGNFVMDGDKLMFNEWKNGYEISLTNKGVDLLKPYLKEIEKTAMQQSFIKTKGLKETYESSKLAELIGTGKMTVNTRDPRSTTLVKNLNDYYKTVSGKELQILKNKHIGDIEVWSLINNKETFNYIKRFEQQEAFAWEKVRKNDDILAEADKLVAARDEVIARNSLIEEVISKELKENGQYYVDYLKATNLDLLKQLVTQRQELFAFSDKMIKNKKTGTSRKFKSSKKLTEANDILSVHLNELRKPVLTKNALPQPKKANGEAYSAKLDFSEVVTTNSGSSFKLKHDVKNLTSEEIANMMTYLLENGVIGIDDLLSNGVNSWKKLGDKNLFKQYEHFFSEVGFGYNTQATNVYMDITKFSPDFLGLNKKLETVGQTVPKPINIDTVAREQIKATKSFKESILVMDDLIKKGQFTSKSLYNDLSERFSANQFTEVSLDIFAKKSTQSRMLIDDYKNNLREQKELNAKIAFNESTYDIQKIRQYNTDMKSGVPSVKNKVQQLQIIKPALQTPKDVRYSKLIEEINNTEEIYNIKKAEFSNAEIEYKMNMDNVTKSKTLNGILNDAPNLDTNLLEFQLSIPENNTVFVGRNGDIEITSGKAPADMFVLREHPLTTYQRTMLQNYAKLPNRLVSMKKDLAGLEESLAAFYKEEFSLRLPKERYSLKDFEGIKRDLTAMASNQVIADFTAYATKRDKKRLDDLKEIAQLTGKDLEMQLQQGQILFDNNIPVVPVSGKTGARDLFGKEEVGIVGYELHPFAEEIMSGMANDGKVFVSPLSVADQVYKDKSFFKVMNKDIDLALQLTVPGKNAEVTKLERQQIPAIFESTVDRFINVSTAHNSYIQRIVFEHYGISLSNLEVNGYMRHVLTPEKAAELALNKAKDGYLGGIESQLFGNNAKKILLSREHQGTAATVNNAFGEKIFNTNTVQAKAIQMEISKKHMPLGNTIKSLLDNNLIRKIDPLAGFKFDAPSLLKNINTKLDKLKANKQTDFIKKQITDLELKESNIKEWEKLTIKKTEKVNELNTYQNAKNKFVTSKQKLDEKANELKLKEQDTTISPADMEKLKQEKLELQQAQRSAALEWEPYQQISDKTIEKKIADIAKLNEKVATAYNKVKADAAPIGKATQEWLDNNPQLEGTGKEWMWLDNNTVSSLKETIISIAAGDAVNLKTEWGQQFVKTLQDIDKGENFAIHKGAYERIKEYGRIARDGDASTILNAIDGVVTKTFKKFALFSTGFHARNILTNVSNGFLAGVNPADLMQAATKVLPELQEFESIVKDIEKLMTTGLFRSADNQADMIKTMLTEGYDLKKADPIYGNLIDEDIIISPITKSGRNKLDLWTDYHTMLKEGIVGNNQINEDLFEEFSTILNRAKGRPTESFKMNNPVSTTAKKASQMSLMFSKRVDDAFKVSMYRLAKNDPKLQAKAVQQGFVQKRRNAETGKMEPILDSAGNPQVDAVGFTKHILFDYNNLSGMEQRIMKTVFPFYTFMRKNLEFQVRNLMKNTQRYNILYNAIQGWQEGFIDEEDQLTDYQQNWIPVWKDNQGDITFIKGNNPFFELDEVLNGSALVNGLNPIFKTPLEMITGYDFFGKRQINDNSSFGLGLGLNNALDTADKAFRMLFEGYAPSYEDKRMAGIVGKKIYDVFGVLQNIMSFGETMRNDGAIQAIGGLLPSLFSSTNIQNIKQQNARLKQAQMKQALESFKQNSRY